VAERRTRRGFFGLAGAGAAAALLGRAPDAFGATALSAAQDRRILQFALEVEQLKAAFYAEAAAKRKLTGELRQFAVVAAGHEQDHADALARALGKRAKKPQHFAFGHETTDAHAFTAAAIALEEAAVGIYNEEAANLRTPALALALEIVSVEGRHAAWIRSLAGDRPAPRAADPGQTSTTVMSTLKRIQHA
jgi:rubrerythrin